MIVKRNISLTTFGILIWLLLSWTPYSLHSTTLHFFPSTPSQKRLITVERLTMLCTFSQHVLQIRSPSSFFSLRSAGNPHNRTSRVVGDITYTHVVHNTGYAPNVNMFSQALCPFSSSIYLQWCKLAANWNQNGICFQPRYLLGGRPPIKKVAAFLPNVFCCVRENSYFHTKAIIKIKKAPNLVSKTYWILLIG